MFPVLFSTVTDVLSLIGLIKSHISVSKHMLNLVDNSSHSLKAAVSAVVVSASFLSVLQLEIVSLVSTSPQLHDSLLSFEAALFASFVFFVWHVWLCTSCYL